MFVSHFTVRSFRTRFFQIACVLVSGFFLFAAPSAHAANTINHQINYQGKLLDSVGAPVSDGAYQMKISLYSTSSGGTPTWTAKGTTGTPTALTVTTTDGLFTVLLGDTSVSGGSQNALTGLDWNNDSLYLGLTVSPDSGEMTPRKHLGAVPQAFNSEQLQGMYASSTATSGNALFIVNQTTNDAATSARTALEVRTSGTSDVHDYLIRGLASGSSVFTVSRSGTVTSTNVNVTGGVNGLIRSGMLTSRHTTSTVIGTFGASIKALITQGRYGYILSTSRNLDIVDLTGANGQGSIGRVASPTFSAIAASGNYVYATDFFSTYTIDVTSSTSPVVRASIADGSGAVVSLEVVGSRLYVGRFGSITVLDASDPLHLRVLGTQSVSGASGYFTVRGNLLYFSDNSGSQVMRIYDVTDPTAFVQVGSVAQATPTFVNVQGSLMVVRNDSPGFSLFDVSNPTSPRLVSVTSLGSYSTTRPVIRGRYFINVSDSGGVNGIQIYDISNPASPVFVDSVSASLGLSATAIDVAGNTLYGVGTNSLEQYVLTQAEFSGLKAHLAEVGRLDVRGGSVFEGTGSFLNGFTSMGGSRVERLSAYATGTSPTFTAINAASTSTSGGWGAYINTLLIGGSASATGTANYQMVATYNSTIGRGICVDDTSTAATCPSGAAASSIIAEGAINGLAFDLAERYAASGDALPGDLLTIDVSTSTQVIRSSVPYDPRLFGIVSTKPGFLLGEGGNASVALAGRVPTHVSVVNGAIAIGDPLTSSQYPGLAMKATKPGRIIGYALESADSTSTIEVFVKPGYDAGSLLSNDGTNATVNDDLLFDTQSATTDQPLQSSSKLIFRGRSWNGIQALAVDYWLGTEVGSTTSSKWGIHSGTSTLFSIDIEGNAEIQNDLVIGGRLYPSARGVAQHDKYIFMDTGPASSTYMATNADGWQANDSYDFAERYYSPDALTPGDVVVVSKQGKLHVQRSVSASVLPVGIVSTKPGFVTGAPASSTYPIALAGRVPTKVSIMNGAISVGDLLAPSTVPGIAVKATGPGPVIGQALESYSESDIGLIEVFVHAGWWGGTNNNEQSIQGVSSTPTISKTHQGLARILVKGTRVHVSFPSVESYPWVQVTPYSEIEGVWWTDHYTETGFDILLKQPQAHELTFAWSVRGLTAADQNISISDGSRGDLDLKTGRLPSAEREDPVPTPPIKENPTASTSVEIVPTPVPVEVEVLTPVEPIPPVIIEERVPVEPEEVIVPEPEVLVVPEPAESISPPVTEAETPQL